MAGPRILLTGFGPFPGALTNPSARLVETLAAMTPSQTPGYQLHAEILPTEWETVAALAPRLHAKLQPHVMIHFGLSRHARSFRIEHSAHNRLAPRADASGALPSMGTVLKHGADRLDTAVPASELTQHLNEHGFAAETSRDAGGYLCNLLYYLSLEWTARQPKSCDALFVHVPPAEADGGPFTDDNLVRGAQAILRFVLASAEAHDRKSAARVAGVASALHATISRRR
jgi:pyroglutamyl-peptidase